MLHPVCTQLKRHYLLEGSLVRDWPPCGDTKGELHCNLLPVEQKALLKKSLQYKHISTLGLRWGQVSQVMQLLTTIHYLLSFNKGKQVDMAILDFFTSFNTVPHYNLYKTAQSPKLWHSCPSALLAPELLDKMHKAGCHRLRDHHPSANQLTPVPLKALCPLLFPHKVNDLPKAMKSQIWLLTNNCLLTWCTRR